MTCHPISWSVWGLSLVGREVVTLPWHTTFHSPSSWRCLLGAYRCTIVSQVFFEIVLNLFIEISEIFDLVNLEIFQSGRPSRKNWFWETTPANHNYPDFFTLYCLLNHFSAFRRVFRTIKYLQPLGASLRLVKIMRKHFMHFLFKSCSADSKAKRQWTSSY